MPVSTPSLHIPHSRIYGRLRKLVASLLSPSAGTTTLPASNQSQRSNVLSFSCTDACAGTCPKVIGACQIGTMAGFCIVAGINPVEQPGSDTDRTTSINLKATAQSCFKTVNFNHDQSDLWVLHIHQPGTLLVSAYNMHALSARQTFLAQQTTSVMYRVKFDAIPVGGSLQLQGICHPVHVKFLVDMHNALGHKS